MAQGAPAVRGSIRSEKHVANSDLLALVLLLSSMSIFEMTCGTEPVEVERITGRELYAEPETVDMNDLSVDVQANAKKGKRFTATCKVDDFILGSMQLRDCRQ